MIPNEGGIQPNQDWFHCGQVVNVTCKDGFQLFGEDQMICTDSRLWYKGTSRCEPEGKLVNYRQHYYSQQGRIVYILNICFKVNF